MAFCMLFEGNASSGEAFFRAASDIKLSMSLLPVLFVELTDCSVVRGLGGSEFEDLCLDWSDPSRNRSSGSCFFFVLGLLSTAVRGDLSL